MAQPIRNEKLEFKFVQILTEIRDLAKTKEELLILIDEDFVSKSVKEKFAVILKELEVTLKQKWEELENYFLNVSTNNNVFITLTQFDCLGLITDVMTLSKTIVVILEEDFFSELALEVFIDEEDLTEIKVYVVTKGE